MAKEIRLDVYSPEEEVANAITHSIGVVGGLIATITMVSKSQDPRMFWSALVFGISLVLLYTASTLYHHVKEKKRKFLFKKLDHIAIYVLIAGTFTPFAWGVLGTEAIGRNVLVAVWLIALAGAIFKLFFTGRFEAISLMSYLGMGWLGYVMFDRIAELLSAQAVDWILYGGAFYTGGVLFYLWRKLKYHHAIWHLCVLAGSFCHFWAIYNYAIPFN